MIHEDDEYKNFNFLICELDRLVEQSSKEKEIFYKSIYEKGIGLKTVEKTGSSAAIKQFEWPKMQNRDQCEEIIIQHLGRLKEINTKLSALNVAEQLVLITDHIEDCKQNTIDFCNSIQHCFQRNLNSQDESLEYVQKLIKLFHDLKAKLDGNYQISQKDQSSFPLYNLTNSVRECFDKFFKTNEIESINFDQLASDLVNKSLSSEIRLTNDMSIKQKEMFFKINLVTERAQISMKKIDDFLSKCHSDELSVFLGKTSKMIDDLKTTVRFDIESADGIAEDSTITFFLKSFQTSLNTFSTKVNQLIDDAIDKSESERNSLNEEMLIGLSNLVASILMRKLTSEKIFIDRKVSKEIARTVHRRSSTKKNKDGRKAIDFAKTDLAAIIKGRNKLKGEIETVSDIAHEQELDNLFQQKLKRIVNLERKEEPPVLKKEDKSKTKDSLKEKVHQMLRDRGQKKKSDQKEGEPKPDNLKGRAKVTKESEPKDDQAKIVGKAKRKEKKKGKKK